MSYREKCEALYVEHEQLKKYCDRLEHIILMYFTADDMTAVETVTFDYIDNIKVIANKDKIQ